MTCHGPAAKDEAAGVHGAQSKACTQCHGGNPDAFDEKGAHSRPRKFMKVPRGACAACHEREGEALARGRHGPPLETRRFRGCVDCHGWHGVKPPTPALFAATCVRCHEHDPDWVELGAALRAPLAGAEAACDEAGHAVAEAEADRVHVRPLRERLDALRAAMQDCAARQHALALEEIEPRARRIRAEAEALAEESRVARRDAEDRVRLLAAFEVLIGLNALLLWRRLRRRRREAA